VLVDFEREGHVVTQSAGELMDEPTCYCRLLWIG
jgi:hypothetical protein